MGVYISSWARADSLVGLLLIGRLIMLHVGMSGVEWRSQTCVAGCGGP